MEHAHATGAVAARTIRSPGPLPLPAVAGWIVGFALVLYLALSNGGYDTIVRNQVGLAVWWIVLLGAIVGVLPGRLSVAAWVGVGLLAVFCLWTGLSTGWSESAERSAGELGKVATYLGFLVLALSAVSRSGPRPLIGGAACAAGAVGVLAVLSRLHPQWFPVNDHGEFLANSRRLAYPLNYWNALAAFLAMGVPVMLAWAGMARRVALQAAAAGVLPVLVLGIYFTDSRGGTLALAVGLVAFVVLAADRLARLATLAVAAVGSAILVAAAHNHPVVEQGLRTREAVAAGDDVLKVAAVVVVGVALLQVAIGLAARHATRPAWTEPGRGRFAAIAAGSVVLMVAIAVAAGAPRAVSDTWDEFRAPPGSVQGTGNADVIQRLQSATGNGRYQYWESSRDAQRAHPWQGTGAGTFEFWWARNGTTQGFVRDGHSLYMETLGELGIPGFVLVVALMLTLLVAGVARTFRALPEVRLALAGATAAIAVFATSAAYEWVWELAAMAALLLALAAVAVTGRAEGLPSSRRPLRSLVPRVVLVVLALVSLVGIGLPLAAATALRDSRAAASEGRYEEALSDARTADRAQRSSAAAKVQEALIAEERGDLGAARRAVLVAVEREPTNWRPWLIRARIEAGLGDGAAAARALRRARALNPRSVLFAR